MHLIWHRKYIKGSTNIVTKSASMNSKCYQPIKCISVLYENSFPKTIIDWNNLKDIIVCPKTIEGFKTALQHRD